MKEKIKNHKQGFTLLELLVVVLIIGILAAIALPQYKMAVTKAKVASILPIMRRWKDALMEYKLQHGDYLCHNGTCPDGGTLGVNWPSDWKNCGSNDVTCNNDYWYECTANEEGTGRIFCQRALDNNGAGPFTIYMYQPDDPDYEEFRNKITCAVGTDEGHKICKALGRKLPEGGDYEYILY